MMFQKHNYIWLGASIVVLIIGFSLMAGGGSEGAEVFSREIFSFRRITLAPLVCLAGYGMVIFSIFKSQKEIEPESSK